MKAFFKDLYLHRNRSNQSLITQLKEEEHLSEQTIPILSHSINAQQIWNARITGKALEVEDLHSLEQCARMDNENYLEALKIIEEREFEENITYRNSKGTEFSNSIQDILFHVANNFTHHKAEITSGIRFGDAEAIETDYIFIGNKGKLV